MSEEQQNRDDSNTHGWRRFLRADLAYAIALFTTAVVIILLLVREHGALQGDYSWGTALFFLLFGLFTITMGFARPGFGHVSFDRVAQVCCILVMGPLDAAWINGLASLIYPLHRIWKGVRPLTVCMAALHNAGMMALVILACGSLYQYLGGPIPLTGLDPRSAGLLLLLALSMQGMNDAIMAVMIWLRKAGPSRMLSPFSVGVELASAPIGILVAIVFATMAMPTLVLLLVTMSLGMLVLKQYAGIRNKLELLVDERTEELRLKSLELERQATHDKLTGLFNRRYADDYLQREIEIATRNSRDFTIALADIDHFKQINDRFSHAAGDAVLCRVAEILVDRCRKTDVVARYGGEEFLLCFPDTNAEFAEQICGQIRKAVSRAVWSDLGGEIAITLSFGIAEVGSDSRWTSVLSTADTRLYEAKHKGRNRVVGLKSGT